MPNANQVGCGFDGFAESERFRGRSRGRRARDSRRPPLGPETRWKPSRRDQSRRRRGLQATPGPGGECDKHSLPGQFFDKERGVACSPALRSKAETPVREDASEPQRCQWVSRTVPSEGYETKYANKGGLSYLRTNVAPRVTPRKVHYSGESSPFGAWPRTPGRPRSCRGCWLPSSAAPALLCPVLHGHVFR